MTLTKTFGLALGFMALAGCAGSVDSDSGSTDTNTKVTEDSWNANATWDSTGVTVDVTNGPDSSGYDFGMAETGSSNGWGGEDCLSEVPSGYDNVTDAGYQVCHGLTATGGYLQTVYDPGDVVDGSTTLFNNSLAGGLTYVLFEASSDGCLSWGDDTGYYSAYSCTIL